MIAAMMCYRVLSPLGALAPVLGAGLLLLLLASALGSLAAILLAMGATQPRRPAVDPTIWWPEREQAAPYRDMAARTEQERNDAIWAGRP